MEVSVITNPNGNFKEIHLLKNNKLLEKYAKSVYIWSDLHLGHDNVINYCNRPFKNSEEMDNLLLENWRNTVRKSDTIINLGDVIIGGHGKYNKDNLTKLINTLPGYKILIMGNHDSSHSENYWKDIGFNEVYKYPIIYKEWYILSHEPIFLNNKMPYLNIHGHIHDKKYDQNCYRNVSVEQTDYKPLDFLSIRGTEVELRVRGENSEKQNNINNSHIIGS